MQRIHLLEMAEWLGATHGAVLAFMPGVHPDRIRAESLASATLARLSRRCIARRPRPHQRIRAIGFPEVGDATGRYHLHLAIRLPTQAPGREPYATALTRAWTQVCQGIGAEVWCEPLGDPLGWLTYSAKGGQNPFIYA